MIYSKAKMRKVLPSDVVFYLEAGFPTYFQENQRQSPLVFESSTYSTIAGLLSLIDCIPEHLFGAMTASTFNHYVASVAAVRLGLEQSKALHTPLLRMQMFAVPAPAPGTNVIAVITEALRECPDQFPSAAISGLEFITDFQRRRDLQLDLKASDTSFQNGDWKSATVMAGAALEALLLWAIEEKGQTEWERAAQDCKTSKSIKEGKHPNEWTLDGYISASLNLKIISGSTATACRLAQDFRNFIHPGRTVRLAQRCTKATALSAQAAVEHVIDELLKKPPLP